MVTRPRASLARFANRFARARAAAAAAVGLTLALAVLGVSRPANAEVTSWLSFGGGYGVDKNANAPTSLYNKGAAMSFAIGVGSTPDASFVIGGIFRSTTYFGLGTDLSIGPRFATGGFARGDWGAAVDIGITGRYWGRGDFGKYPVDAMVFLGAPYGFQIGLGTELFSVTGAPMAQGYTALIELDLLRLTVMRRGSTEKSWPNPAPATAPDPASLHSIVNDDGPAERPSRSTSPGTSTSTPPDASPASPGTTPSISPETPPSSSSGQAPRF